MHSLGKLCISVPKSATATESFPATVDFTVLEPDDYSYVNSSESASFKADNLSAAPDGYGGEIFSGEISVVKDSARVREQSSMLAVSLVLRDDAGAIVYGYSTFVDWPSEAVRARSRWT